MKTAGGTSTISIDFHKIVLGDTTCLSEYSYRRDSSPDSRVPRDRASEGMWEAPAEVPVELEAPAEVPVEAPAEHMPSGSALWSDFLKCYLDTEKYRMHYYYGTRFSQDGIR